MENEKKPTQNVNEHPLKSGNNVFIRTVTNYFTGTVVSFDKDEILLKDASWVASTKRWADSLKNSDLDEVEPYPPGVVAINRMACVDICHWLHPLPLTQK